MLVSHAMTRNVKLVSPNETIGEAARVMGAIDVGALPVSENDGLVGMVTDRDMVIRGLAMGRGPETPIREVMSEEVLYCFEDQDLREVADNMSDMQVRRLPVLDRDKRLVGILSLADVTAASTISGAAALHGISEPSSQHNPSRT